MADRPAAFYLDALRKLQGAPHVSYPNGSSASIKAERVQTVPMSDPLPAYGDDDADPDLAAKGCRLTVLDVLGNDNGKFSIYTVHEALGSRTDQDGWNEQPKTYPYGDANFPRVTRKYRFFKDAIPALVIGSTADTIFTSSKLFNLQEETESAVVVVLTAFFDDIPTVAQQEAGGSGTEGLGLSIAYPYGAAAYPVLTCRARVLNSGYAAATDNQACPIPGYTTLLLSDQGKEPAADAPTVSVMTLVYERLPGVVITSNDASKVPRQLTAIPAYYLNGDLLITSKQVVTYGTVPDPITTTLLSSKVDAVTTLKAIKTNVARANPTLPIAYLPKRVEATDGAEYRLVVQVDNPADLNGAVDSAISLMKSVVGGEFYLLDYDTAALSATQVELRYTYVGEFPILEGAEYRNRTPEEFLEGIERVTKREKVDTTLAPAELDDGPLVLSCVITPESVYRGEKVTISLPEGTELPTLTDTESGEDAQGETVRVERQLSDDDSPPEEDTFKLLRWENKDIGGGKVLRTVRELDADEFPELSGQRYIPSLGVAVPFIVQDRAAGDLAGTATSDITPLNKRLNRVKTEVVPTEVVEAYWRRFAVNTRLSVPDVLEDVLVTWNTSNSDGDGTETGSSGQIGAGTVSLSLPNSAEGGAGLQPEITPVLAPNPSADNLPAYDYYFFIADNSTREAILTKLGTFVFTAEQIVDGAAVKDWPVWRPRQETFILQGQNGSVRTSAAARLSLSTDSTGSIKSYAKSSGTSYSRSGSLSTRAVEIRPTIHGELIVADNSRAGTATSSSASSILDQIPSISKPMEIAGSVTPTTLVPTPGPTAIPTSGLHAQSIDVQPASEFAGYCAVRVRVFDFSTVAPPPLPLPPSTP